MSRKSGPSSAGSSRAGKKTKTSSSNTAGERDRTTSIDNVLPANRDSAAEQDQQQGVASRSSMIDEGSREKSRSSSRNRSGSNATAATSSGSGDGGRASGLDDRGADGLTRKVSSSSSFQDRLSSSSHGAGGTKASKMEKVFELLKGVDQDENFPEGLAETAEDLVSAQVMNHPDRDARLLVACCLVEVFRIYAPDAPYTDNQILAIFSLIITQLRGLCSATKRGESRTELTYHLLESLATCKSCVIVALLANEGVPGGLEQLVEMFEVLLTGVRQEHDADVTDLVLETLKLCMDELDVMHQPLLDTVLIQLLPVTKDDSPASYQLAAELLKATFSKVHMPISQFVNSILSGATGNANESDLKEHVLPLVYELHKVSPLMVTYIIPEVAEQLKAEDIKVRSGACALLGRLFASKHADFGVEKPAIWSVFLGRFIDADSSIRGMMVEAGAITLRRKPALRNELLAAIGLRLQDPDAKVRTVAVKHLVDLVNVDATGLPNEVLQGLGHRIKDRKGDIRQYASVGMGRAYYRHVSSKWLLAASPSQAGEEGPAAGSRGKGNKAKGKGRATSTKKKKQQQQQQAICLQPPSAEISSKLGWVPSSLVKAMGFRQDWDLRAIVLHLLDDLIIPKALSDEARAAGLAHLEETMDPAARQGLTWILQDKRKVRGGVLRYLDARDLHKATPKDKALAVAVEARLQAVMALHPTPGGKMTVLNDLNGKADKKIFRLLRTICARDVSHGTATAARAEVLKKIGSKTTLGIYVKALSARCSVFAIGSAGFQYLCSACIRGLEEGEEETYLPPLGLLETLTGVSPEQTRGQQRCLAAVVMAARDAGLENEMTRFLELIAAGATVGASSLEGVSSKGKRAEGEEDEEMPDGFFEALVDLCTKEGTPKRAAVAVRALSALACSPSNSNPCFSEKTRSSEISTGRSSKAAKAAITAAAAAAAAAADGDEVAECARFSALEALREAASDRSLSGDFSNVSAGSTATGVAALAAFAQEFPREFERHESKAFGFAMERIKDAVGAGGDGGGVGERGKKGKGKRAFDNDRGGGGGGGVKKRGATKKGTSSSPSTAISNQCRTLCASIELAVSCLMPPPPGAKGGRGGGGGPSRSSPSPADRGCSPKMATSAGEAEEALLKTVFALLAAEGQLPAGIGEGKEEGRQEEMDTESRESLRLTGSTCVARLCMFSGSVRTLLSPERWHSLAWTLMDPSKKVRAGFLREVCRCLEQTGGGRAVIGGAPDGGAGVAARATMRGGGQSTLRFLAYLCLAAFEAEPLRREARLAIAKKVRQLRLAHDHAAAAAAAATATTAAPGTATGTPATAAASAAVGEGDGGEGGGASAASLEASMPEYVLPYAIHLLAHHPDFPVDKNDKPRMKNLERYLEFLLEPLVGGGQGGEADNLSLLLQMLDTITTSYADALEPSSNRIHVAARVARQILASRIRTQSNLQPYPGAIFLPAPLFQRRARSSPGGGRPASPNTPFSPASSAGKAGGGGDGSARRASVGSNNGSASSSSSFSRRVRARTTATSTGAPPSIGSPAARGNSSPIAVNVSKKNNSSSSSGSMRRSLEAESSSEASGRRGRATSTAAAAVAVVRGGGDLFPASPASSAPASSSLSSQGLLSPPSRRSRSNLHRSQQAAVSSPFGSLDGGSDGPGPLSVALSSITTPPPEIHRQSGGIGRGRSRMNSTKKALGTKDTPPGSPQWGSPVRRSSGGDGPANNNEKNGESSVNGDEIDEGNGEKSSARTSFFSPPSTPNDSVTAGACDVHGRRSVAASSVSPEIIPTKTGAGRKEGGGSRRAGRAAARRGGRVAVAAAASSSSAASGPACQSPPSHQQLPGDKKRPQRQQQQQQQQRKQQVVASRKRSGRPPSAVTKENGKATAVEKAGKNVNSVGGIAMFLDGSDACDDEKEEEDNEDMPSPLKKRKRGRGGGRSGKDYSIGDTTPAASLADNDSSNGNSISNEKPTAEPSKKTLSRRRKAPLTARQEKPVLAMAVAVTPDSKYPKKKLPPTPTGGGGGSDAGPTARRGKNQLKRARGAAEAPKNVGAGVRRSPRQVRAAERGKKGSVAVAARSHKREKGGDVEGEDSKEGGEQGGDSDDDALMALSRRRRAAMQE